jgi:hypothetical protein
MMRRVSAGDFDGAGAPLPAAGAFGICRLYCGPGGPDRSATVVRFRRHSGQESNESLVSFQSRRSDNDGFPDVHREAGIDDGATVRP